MKQFTLIEIDWIDSIHDSGWHRASDHEGKEQEEADKQMMHKTVGYFLQESKQAISVVQSYGLNRKDPTVDAVMRIPKKAIIKIKKP